MENNGGASHRETRPRRRFTDRRDQRYIAEMYSDASNAHYLANPEPMVVTTRVVTGATRQRLALAHGGGQAIRLRPPR